MIGKNRNFWGLIAIIASLITVVYFIRDIKNLIIWWPSGWIVTFILLLFIFTNFIRIIYLRMKYGPKNNYKVVKFSGNKVYLLKNNKIRWIENPNTLFKLGYDFDDVEQLDGKSKREYEEGNSISVYF